MKVLQIVKTAYRATIEEQDDTIVWLSHALCRAGAELDVVLQGNAVNYAVAAQNAAGLSFGDWRQTEPPRIARDIASLIQKNVSVFASNEDLRERGIDGSALLDGVKQVSRGEMAALFERYDSIWQW